MSVTMRSAAGIVQDILTNVSESIKAEFEKESEKMLADLTLKYKQKHKALVTQYLSGVKFEMNQAMDRNIVELRVIISD